MTSVQRSDQVRNRHRLVSAAVEAALQDGGQVSMEAVARQAGLAPSTLYRHFPTRDSLMERVLDHLVTSVRDNATRAQASADPIDAFRAVFSHPCTMPEEEVRAFAQIAASSTHLDAYAHRLIVDIVSPVTARLNRTGAMRRPLEPEDIAVFIRMIDTAGAWERREIAVEVLLAGILKGTPAISENSSG